MYGTKFVNDNFFREVIKDAPDKARVLLVYFALKPERIAPHKIDDIEQFENNKGSKVLNYEVADESTFMEQLSRADVVYFGGGSSSRILDALAKYDDLKNKLNGKIVAGDSAGAKVLCSIYYSQKSNEITEGLGILPIKIICHYEEKYRDVLKDIKPELETWCLPEYQFRTIHIQ